MNDRQCKLFEQVVESGSFAAAARANYVSTQSVAQQMTRLEDEVGAALLERSAHGVAPTEAGRVFYEGIREINHMADSLVAQCRAIGNPERTLIRIGSSENYSLDLFARFVPDFLRTHPGADIDYCPVGPDPLEGLCANAYDVVEGTDVLVTERAREWGIAFEPLIGTRRCCVVTTKSPLARKEAVRPEDLLGMRVYVFSFAWAARLCALLERSCPGIELHELSELPSQDFRSLGRGADAEVEVALLPEHMAGHYSPLISIPFEADETMAYGLLFLEEQRDRLESFFETAHRAF